MANLLEVANLAFNTVFPIPNEKTANSLEEFIAQAKIQYASSMWIYRQEQIATDGYFQMPSDLLTEIELDVNEKEIDLSKLEYLAALPNDLWLQNVGGINCECKYVKTTYNLAQLLCDDDSMNDSDHLFYILGKKIKFLKEPHKSKLPITYANTGTRLNEREIEVNDYVAEKVGTKLLQIYGKRMPVDDTNNQTPNT